MIARAGMLTVVLSLAMAGPILAQEPSFDAASVRVVRLASHPVFGNHGGPGTKDPTRVHLCCVGMFSLLMTAYDAGLDQIFGPSWIMDNMGPNLYEVDATMPAGTTEAQYRLMMQQLLKDRFGLAVHREKRNFPGYELVIAEGGPKLRASQADPDFVAPDSSPLPERRKDGAILPPGPQLLTSLGWGVIIVQAQQQAIHEVVKGMGRMINQSFGENPNDFASAKARVIDRTGLTGVYDFTLRFSCELCQFATANGATAPPPPPAPADAPGGEPSIFTAVEKQLGLKLNKIKDVPLDVIVADHVEKLPTGN
jgi:uncharacterized protein (TIGR03435 family)